MGLERCECCLRYMPGEQLSIGSSEVVELKFSRCEECEKHKTVPGYVATAYWGKIYNKVELNMPDIDTNHIYYDNKYMSLREYYIKTKHF